MASGESAVERVGLRRSALLATLVLVLGVVAAGSARMEHLLTDANTVALRGVVVSPAGQPIPGARVTAPGAEAAYTGAEGQFEIPGDEAAWVTVSASGWVTRTRAVGPADPTVVRLVPRRAGTVVLAFGGDVMFGRRYFDPQENGAMGGLLSPTSSSQEHAPLMEGVGPLLRDADVTVVNLESPLAPEPFLDPRLPRPPQFHPTKEHVFASSPEAAGALRSAGIDVVGLANNHLYDRLRPGVLSTRRSLRGAGFRPGEGFFGAGRTSAEAWAPAVVQRGGQRVSVTGCTSILRESAPLVVDPISYVANRVKAGAARCSDGQLGRTVKASSKTSDVNVAMVHGGFEYVRDPSSTVRRLSDAAAAAGADLIVNHHPHVLGGMRFAGGNLTAWSMGNLFFDQTLWPTFDSSILQVVMRRGRVVGAWAEPLRIDGFLPTGVFGPDADWVVRGQLARSEGPWVNDHGSLWLDVPGHRLQESGPVADQLSRIRRGCAPGAGRELLWTGDFEGRQLDRHGPAPLWNVGDGEPYRKVLSDAARDGSAGVLLHRANSHDLDVVLHPRHRVLVDAEDRLTMLVDHRALHGDPDAELTLGWYNDTRGGSQAQTEVELPVTDGWATSRVDVTVPENAVAVMPTVRLRPPESALTQLAVDNVRLVNMSEPGCEYVTAGQQVTDTALRPLEPAPEVTPVVGEILPATAPERLPALLDLE